MSELSDISTEDVSTTRSPTDNTMMHGVTEKTGTSSSFSERVKNTLGNFFTFTTGTGRSDEVDIQEEEKDDDEQDDFGSQLSLNSSTHENGAPTNRETGSLDRCGVVMAKNKTIDASQQSREIVTMTNSEVLLIYLCLDFERLPCSLKSRAIYFHGRNHTYTDRVGTKFLGKKVK